MALLASRARPFLVMSMILPAIGWTARKVARHLENGNDGQPTMGSRGLNAVGTVSRKLRGKPSHG